MTTTRKAAFGFAALFTLLAVAGGMELPADAHTGNMSLTPGPCHGDLWTVTVDIGATNPELHPRVWFDNSNASVAGSPAPYHNVFTVAASQEHFSAGSSGSYIKWDDGFQIGLPRQTVSRSEGCAPEATTTTTSRPPCNPAPGDNDQFCTGGPTSPPSTAPTVDTTAPSTSVEVTAPSAPATSSPETSTPPPTSSGKVAPPTHPARVGPPTSPPKDLPGTGSSVWWPLLTAVALLSLGTACVWGGACRGRDRLRS